MVSLLGKNVAHLQGVRANCAMILLVSRKGDNIEKGLRCQWKAHSFVVYRYHVHQCFNIVMTEEIKRGQCLLAYTPGGGRSPQAIAEFNELSLSFVYKMKRKLEVSEHPEDIGTTRGKPTPRSDVRTLEFVARVWPQTPVSWWTRIPASPSGLWLGCWVLPTPRSIVPCTRTSGTAHML